MKFVQQFKGSIVQRLIRKRKAVPVVPIVPPVPIVEDVSLFNPE
jgi:hypothetical protein